MATHSETAALLAFLREQGPLKRAYPLLKSSLPGRLSAAREPHQLLLSVVEVFCGGLASEEAASSAAERANAAEPEAWPGAAVNAYCVLLLDAARSLPILATTFDRTCAGTLAQAHPHLFRKLSAAYPSDATNAAALSTVETLIERGDPAEAAQLAAEHGLLGEVRACTPSSLIPRHYRKPLNQAQQKPCATCEKAIRRSGDQAPDG